MVSASHFPSPRLTVDLDAVAANYRTLRAHAAGVEVGAVVKADAYGLGAAAIAPVLTKAGCRSFFVATEEEGAALLPHFATGPVPQIYVLEGVAETPGLTSVLNSRADVAALKAQATRRGTPQPAAIHVDTGMNRLGFAARDLAALLDNPDGFAGLSLTLVMSHLACADVPDAPENTLQLHRFSQIRMRLPQVPASLANSAGALLGAGYRFDLVRPGIALYGGNPVSVGANLFRPTVTFEAPLLQVRFVDRGDSVGYAATYRAGGPTRIATIAAGYADGFLRAAGNRGSVMIGGHAADIVGRVSMDLVTVDVTALPHDVAVPGAMAELIGQTRTLDAVARDARTISYEVLTRLGGRLARHYVGGRETGA